MKKAPRLSAERPQTQPLGSQKNLYWISMP
jgi:hypothetical protein